MLACKINGSNNINNNNSIYFLYSTSSINVQRCFTIYSYSMTHKFPVQQAEQFHFPVFCRTEQSFVDATHERMLNVCDSLIKYLEGLTLNTKMGTDDSEPLHGKQPDLPGTVYRIYILTECEVRTISYGPSFFPLTYGARA